MRRTLGAVSAVVLAAASGGTIGCAPAPEVRADGAAVLFNGRSLAGWKVLEGDVDYEESGEVRVEDGAILLEPGEPLTGVGWTGEFPCGDYDLRLEARRFKGGDFFCGMTFPVGGSHATLILGGWGGGIVGISDIDGYASNDNATTRFMEFEDMRWYRIRLRVAEGRLRVWIDEKLVIEQPIEGHTFSVWPQQEPARPFGVTTWRTGGALRGITVRPACGPEPYGGRRPAAE